MQEDLCLLGRDERGWRLIAAAVCFPSGWSLAGKIGCGLEAIHDPVPAYAGSMSERVSRIFDHLREDEPLVRFNWSIHADGELHHPAEPGESPDRFASPDSLTRAHVRVERQTLRQLPGCASVLFTIRTHIDPLAALAGHPRGRSLADGLRRQLLALDAQQAAYKGLAGARMPLAAALARIAAGECD